VPGLFAAGFAAHIDASGRHNSAGMPSMWCNVTGWLAGEAAAEFAAQVEQPRPPQDAVDAAVDATLRPLLRSDGIEANDLAQALREMQGNLAWVTVLNDVKIHRALEALAELKHRLERAHASDVHALLKVHDVGHLVDNLNTGFQATLHRTESRDRFNRDEYPYTDDRGWHCWLTARRTVDGMVFEKAPIDPYAYPIKPPPGYFDRPPRLSPIVAMFRDQPVTLVGH
jgi:succinate dehydrogenase/fumarate reductase flavoprotein subunit